MEGRLAGAGMNRRETLAEASDRSLGVYLHVPFCATACDFCAFYQVQGDREAIVGYLEAIERELSMIVPDRQVETAFWGGGTPGLLPAKDLARLGTKLIERIGQPTKEWTAEMAPSTVKADKLARLKEIGVTRISLGVQSFDDRLLDQLGRQHSARQVYKAYDLIRGTGFASVNIDLMFALPGQSEAEFQKDLDEVARLDPDHLSTYCLTFEEDTALYVKLSEGKVARSVERERAFYCYAWEAIKEMGFAQYEISNYAKPGHRSVHNLSTWRMNDWIGIGPSAASQYGGWRGANPADLDQWRAALERGERAATERQELTAELLMEDSLIFGLRMNDGASVSALEEQFGISVEHRLLPLIQRWEADGLASYEGGALALTKEGRLLADAMGSELVGLIAI